MAGQYQGVNTDHPAIVKAIENMTKQGEPREKICRVVGMPHEVVERVQREMQRKSG